MKKQRGKRQPKKDNASPTGPADLLELERDLIAYMERREARERKVPEMSEEEADAGGDEIVSALARLAHYVPPNPNPRTELEAKQERLRQKLASVTFFPPHVKKQ